MLSKSCPALHTTLSATLQSILAAKSMLSSAALSPALCRFATSASLSNSVRGTPRRTRLLATSFTRTRWELSGSDCFCALNPERTRIRQLGLCKRTLHNRSQSGRHSLITDFAKPLGASTQSMHAASTADIAHAQKQRARQQAAASLQPILPEASTAASPFLGNNSSHSERARVDYSQAQRPLHVRIIASQMSDVRAEALMSQTMHKLCSPYHLHASKPILCSA